MFIAFEGFYSSELWSLWIKTIRKLACEELLATKYTKRKAQKHSKGFYMFFLLKIKMETVTCEYCGKVLPKNEATFCEDGGFYACPECAEENLVTCERCGMLIDHGSAYSGWSEDSYLCECCHDDLFG